MEQSVVDHWIGGAYHQPLSDGSYRTQLNPSTGRAGARVAVGDAEAVEQAVKAALAAAPAWRTLRPAARGRMLTDISRELRARRDQFAQWEMEETGKPLRTALAEVDNSADFFEFYAGLVNLPAGDVIDVDISKIFAYTRREPFGLVAIITPWNLPLNQAARAVAPAIAAGNVVIVKPSETTSRTTVELAKLASESCGLPDGVINVVVGAGSTLGPLIVGHPAVRKVAFTGSVEVGRTIGEIAADRILPLTLELGGKSANIVFADADLEVAAREAVRAFTSNNGQVCSAGTRLLVDALIHDDMVAAVAAAAAELRPAVDYGPSITADQYRRVQEYLKVADEEGAVATLGGTPGLPAGVDEGFFTVPTIYTQVRNDMRIAREEVFGPVLVILPFTSEEEAVAIANDSEFGLVAGVFTGDVARAIRVAEQLECGQVFINSWSSGAVQTSFGGQKASGYGREKGIEALNHYAQLKSVTISMS